MKFNIDEKSLKSIKNVGLTAENVGSALFVLSAFKDNNIDLLDALDDHTKERRALMLYKNMERLGLIEEAKDGNTYYKISKLGIDVLDAVSIKEPIKLPPSKNPVEDWIQEWVDLFPDDVLSGGKKVKSDVIGCTSRMKAFKKKYPEYDKDLIFRATRSYLKLKESEGWKYTRCAVYFIGKLGEGSDLATWCQDLKDSGQTTESEFSASNLI